MVYLEDEGSRFEAPLQVVWEYLTEGTAHDSAHHSTRHARFEPLTHSSFVYSAERNVEGRWEEESIRVSVFEPVAISSVFLKGPFEGSKMVYVYKPEGRRTRIDVYGDFASATLPPDRLVKAVHAMLETEFAEDAPAVHRLAASR
jgi:hypothetical protein